MNKLILNFFGEEVPVENPKTLQNLKQEISNKFCFSPSDAAEILVSYISDIKKTFIKTEQDFVDFIKKKIYKVDLDISPDSQLYQKSVLKLQEENEKNKKELEELILKKEELKKKNTNTSEESEKKIKKIAKKIKKLKKKKRKLVRKTNEEKEKIKGEINETNNRIVELRKVFGLPIVEEEKKTESDNSKPKKKKVKKNKVVVKKKVIKKIIKHVKKVVNNKDEKKSKEEEKDMFGKINESINTMVESINKIISEQLSKKEKEIEIEKKKIADSKIQLKEDEIKGFFDFNSITRTISGEINKWTKFIVHHTNELTNTLSQKYNECINSITSIKIKGDEKLRDPAPKKSIQKFHEGIKCHGCGSFPIIGNRFKCCICSNFNFCEKCEEQNKNLHLHPFIKIYSPEMAL